MNRLSPASTVKGNSMKYKRLTLVLIVSLSTVLLLVYGFHFFFLSLYNLPQGEYIGESTSPQGTYIVKLYETNPALSAGGTRGEVINNITGKKKTIYWEYNRNVPKGGVLLNTIKWEDDETVIINGKKLNVKKDVYDFRRKGHGCS